MASGEPGQRKRWWLWLVLPPLLCCTGGGLMTLYARLTIDSNPVYVAALKRANASGELKHRLGSPITVSGVESLRVSFMGNGTSMLLDIEGPKGAGRLVAVARGEEAGSLEIFKMRVRVDGTGEIIPLDGGGRSGEDF
jgi:hypothetical protein